MAGSKEMETLVSTVIEEQISSICGLKNVRSISQEGVSIVFGEFTLDTDPINRRRSRKLVLIP
ncbi:MAG: hypothetical protein V1752_00080 [Candidatus Firestonebacteria bacterium]